VARAAGIVHTILEACRRWRWTARNVADDTQPISVPKRRTTAPEASTTAKLVALAYEADPEFGLYLRVAAILGSRRGEACGLRWPAVDLDGATLTIDNRLVTGRDSNGHEVVVERPGTKGGNGRRVPLDERTIAELRRQRARLAERAMMCGVPFRADGFVFSYEPDASVGWKPHTVTQRFRRFRDKAGPEFAGVRLHDLRHYVASFLIDQGVPTVVVSQHVGHSSTRTTEDVYGHAVTATARAATDLLAAALDGADRN
jgi:integrase